MPSAQIRKIIHVDMDAFFASVEERDNPELRGKPVAVGYDGKRGVVATANYEARKYGVHSAMATSTAKRLCPQLIFIPSRIDVYRAISNQIREVFYEFTDLVEPASLDEAYLDVTVNKKNMRSAWTVAQNIRDKIFAQTGLTASAGVSYNKFLAKSASDLNKPNGQYLISPAEGDAFIAHLPIAKFHGIGPATTEKMKSLGIHTGADLRAWTLSDLQSNFGKLGGWYYRIARGEDDRPVEPHRIRKSVSSETTFVNDTTDLEYVLESLDTLANEVWLWAETAEKYGRTVTVKIKWSDFEQSTRSRTEKTPIDDKQLFRQISAELLRSVFPFPQGIRLIGVGVSNFDIIKKKTSAQISLNI